MAAPKVTAPTADGMDDIERENRLMQQELLRLDLEEKRASAEVRRSRLDERAQARQSVEMSLADANREQELMQSVCTHRKGGKNANQILLGNNANYAVVKHVLPFGDLMIMCQRCFKQWHRPKEADFPTKAEYRVAVKEYMAAVNLPTDNETSGSKMFQRVEEAAA